MKILMITPLAPYPPNAGVRIRLWEQIRYLGQRHDLTVVSFVSSLEEYAQRHMLDGRCRRAVMVMHSHQHPQTNLQDLLRLPEVLQRYNRHEMREVLAKLRSDEFDIVLIEQLFMAQYHELFSMCKVLQEHNIESDIIKQLTELRLNSNGFGQQKDRAFQNAMWMLMRRYENETWPKFPLRITVSKKDKQELDRRCPTGKTVTVENGINIQSIRPVDNGSSRKILFMGTMNYEPNVDAALYLNEAIMPAVWQKDPTAELVIAGRDPAQAVLDLRSDPRIEVIANPDDMNEIARKCRLTVVSLRSGGGTRIKILHSMALGLPVVSTSLGCEGLSVVDGRNIIVQDEPSQFANAILQVIANDELAKQLRSEGRRLVEERYDWSIMFEQLEKEMQNLVNSSKC